METIEYWSIVDKTKWERGQWDAEPDKVQWCDPETGLVCLALRGPVGSWCGYVGVPKGHLLYDCGYSKVVDLPKEYLIHCFYKHRYPELPVNGGPPLSLDCYLNAHGGITFAGASRGPSEKKWKQQVTAFNNPKLIADAKNHPLGDSAQAIAEWKDVIGDYDLWKERYITTSVSHVGEPEDLWWFGFDCAHSMDLAPKMEADLTVLLPRRKPDVGTYRALPYIKEQCTELAKQLTLIQHLSDGGTCAEAVSNGGNQLVR